VRFKKTKQALNLQPKNEALIYLFFPASLKSTIQDPQELNKKQNRKVDWERMSRSIRSAWK